MGIIIRYEPVLDSVKDVLEGYIDENFSRMEKSLRKWWWKYPNSVKEKLRPFKSFIDFKENDHTSIINETRKLNGKPWNLLREYCINFNGNHSFYYKLIDFTKKIFGRNGARKDIENMLKQKMDESIENTDLGELYYEATEHKRKYNELSCEEKIKISELHKEGSVNSSKIVKGFILKEKKLVYSANRYRKILLVKGLKEVIKKNLIHSDLLNSIYKLIEETRKKRFRYLDEDEITDIYRKNKLEKIKAKDLINDYSLSSKYVVYKCNKYVKNKFVNSLNNIFGYFENKKTEEILPSLLPAIKEDSLESLVVN
jgi:hypothetical protein